LAWSHMNIQLSLWIMLKKHVYCRVSGTFMLSV
jgi:hypothetical protein